jgi:glutaredoxin-like YruB-family protein
MAKKIEIYSTPTCPYCHLAADYFKEKGIEFTNYDVSVDKAKAQEMIKKSGQMGVPVIDIDGKIIVGFNRPEIEKALA